MDCQYDGTTVTNTRNHTDQWVEIHQGPWFESDLVSLIFDLVTAEELSSHGGCQCNAFCAISQTSLINVFATLIVFWPVSNSGPSFDRFNSPQLLACPRLDISYHEPSAVFLGKTTPATDTQRRGIPWCLQYTGSTK